MSTQSDNQSLKAKEHAGWTEVAPGWRKHDARLRDSFAAVSERMLSVARIGPGQRVLDVACGTGEPAIAAAEQVGPRGHVLATDFAEEMLTVAREKAARRGLSQLEFRRADGEELQPGGDPFDAALIRFGIMFMPDPAACLRRVRAALRPGGRIAVATWASPDVNPWLKVALSVLKSHLDVPAPPPGAPGLFAFADPERLRTTLQEGDFQDVKVEEVHLLPGGAFDSGRDFFTFLRELSAPLARLYGQLPPDLRPQVEEEIACQAERHRQGGQVCLKGLAWVAVGTVAG
jgi:2-polyprenyl-3-methyl-5-hydroxy-6-metoxy-1,4-benzoquinol methylase